MRKLLIFLFLILIYGSSNAQMDTTKFIYQLDFSAYSDTLVDNQKSSLLIKFAQQEEFDELGVSHIIDRLIEEGKITIYKDEDCTKGFEEYEFPFSTFGAESDSIRYRIGRNEPFTSKDTSLSFTVKTCELQILFPNEKSLFQLEQHWKFDEESQGLSNTIQKINLGYFENQQFKRLCSIKNNPSIVQNIQTELEKPSVIWAKQIEYEMSFDTISSEDILQRKISSKEHFNAHEIVDIHGKVIPNEVAFLQYFDGFDTIPSANPETFEREDWIVRYCYNPDDNSTYRIVQDFYFDTEINSINTKILAIAPLRNYYDNFGYFRFTRLMFWIVYDDDFLKRFN